MLTYALVCSGGLIHAAGLGLSRHRGALSLGALVLALLVAAGQYLFADSVVGAVGVITGVATIAATRYACRWLAEGGALLLAQLGAELVRAAVPVLADLLRAIVWRIAEVFAPTPAPVAVSVERAPAPVAPVALRYCTDQELRWSGGGTAGPAPAVTAAAEAVTAARDTMAPPAAEAGTARPPALTLVPRAAGPDPAETFSDWLPAAVERIDQLGGFNAVAAIAAERFGVKRRTFARRVAEHRESLAAA